MTQDAGVVAGIVVAVQIIKWILQWIIPGGNIPKQVLVVVTILISVAYVFGTRYGGEPFQLLLVAGGLGVAAMGVWSGGKALVGK